MWLVTCTNRISCVALHDTTRPAAALLLSARGEDAFNYDKTLVAADNLSGRDYTVVISGPSLPVAVRLNRSVIDDYNSALTSSFHSLP